MSQPNDHDILLSSGSVGEAVRRLREAKGMTLRALGEKVGVTAPFLSDFEHDRRRMKDMTKLADALGVDARELDRLSPRIPKEVVKFLEKNPAVLRMVVLLMPEPLEVNP